MLKKTTLLGQIIYSKYAHLILDGTVDAHFEVDGVWHTETHRCKAARYLIDALPTTKVSSWSSRRVLPEPTPVKVSGLKDGQLCLDCFGELRWNSPLQKVPNFALIESLFEVKRQAKSIGAINKSTSAGALQKRLREIPALIETCQQRSESVHEELRPEYTDLVKSLKETEAKLRRASHSPEARAVLERTVQQQLVPTKFKEQSFELDSTMMLIGVSPAPSHYIGAGTRSDTIKAVIETYSLRQDKEAVVLYAPAYFYSYLLGNLFFKSGKDYLVVSASDPGDAEARDNAAQLWDPQNRSVLACLSQATATGTALSGD